MPADVYLTSDLLEPYRLPGYTGVVAIDAVGTVLFVSAELEGLAGIHVPDVVGRNFLDYVHVDDADQAVESFGGVGDRPGYHQALEFRIRNGDRSQAVDVVAENRLADPTLGVVLLHLSDPSDRRRSAQLLNQQAEIVRKIALGGSLDSAIREVLSFTHLALPAFSPVAYLVDEGRVTASISDTVEPPAVRRVVAAIEAAASIPATAAMEEEEIIVAVELPVSRWSGSTDLLPDPSGCVWSVPIRFDRGMQVLGCLDLYGPPRSHPQAEDWAVLRLASRLIAIAIDHARTQEQLIRDAEVDPLTGTPNRRVVTGALARLLERREVGRSVCFIDLDRLKVVNDAIGHEAGDLVIREAADRLTSLIGADGLVGRFGGDEFVAIAASDEIECDEFAQRCLDAFAEPIMIGGRGWQLSASVGVVVVEDQRTPSDVLRDADTAMYEAKRAGRGRWRRFVSSDRDLVIRRMRLEQRLGDAVRDEHIAAWFQPMVSATDFSIVGAEALARWEIEPNTWVPPGEFVPLAEELGLIDDLGMLMLTLALEGCETLNESTSECRVSVNVSPLQLRSDRLFTEVKRIGALRGDRPALCFEMTEQHMIDDTDATIERLNRLADLGVELAVDDFGTGYSSLAMLHRVPARVLKVDRGLVSQMDLPSGRAVVRAVIGVAKAYGMRTIAEGVETADEALALRRMGVDQLQGFLFGPAEPLDVLRERLTTRTWPWDVAPEDLHVTSE